MAVPFFSVRETIEREWPRLEPLLDEALDAGVLVNGPIVARLEREVAAYTGAAHAVAVASGTDALIVALKACGLGRGDEVVVPVYTFFATVSSVMHAGARPVLADVDARTYAMAADDVERRIGERTAALMPVHPFIQMADVQALSALAERAGAFLAEDSAQAIGMCRDGKHAGLFGRFGILSFFPAKTLGALGDAGMILTNDEDLAERACILRNHGQAPGERPYVWELLGMNSRMDDLQAAVLLTRLASLDAEIERRAELARLYDELLEPLAGLVAPPALADPPTSNAVYYVYVIEAERRDALVRHLTARGIGTEVYYPRPLHLQPCLRQLGYRDGDFPVAERAATRAVALPLYPDMSDADVEETCAAIADFYAPRSARRDRAAVASG